jgi:alkanesulfonate monooxygenase SsuD/methylene tetrahydromethanopterin reductase-like flavin-dependent oxidoreductase (luciferase family)
MESAMSDQDRLARMRALRETLKAADDGRGIWVLLAERFPEASLVAKPEDVRAALDLAYELGYDDGGNSTLADFHEDNPDAVQRCREVLRLIGELAPERKEAPPPK